MMISFISGGARSGKSQFAEKLAVSAFHERKSRSEKVSLYYVATSKRSDAEMKERIRIHQQMRIVDWETIEEPYDFSLFLSTCTKQDVLLVDCVTIWLNNVMFNQKWGIHKIEETVDRWIKIIKEKELYVIFVSNDVNEELPHYFSREVLQYVWTLQHVHKRLVTQAEQVIQVTAGLPIFWKGEA
ncbi:adenosylcobinamide-phosphate guanylyltransferase [Halalkalibacter wakoensis JCM 9140]|uniref:Adenosylcobinamide kinase n=1 Tax=Halalkalibacter wakoensis JCM 9140 TaxID=1236970 RepID=W4PZV8_9BACI|nr:bifunctional adenosylcobinamide kinase/adenosylcobinamide-phosphate guanylyltransferase [Halalkalibacter wakoensis]GAE24654.1 adenosylcobinamide-phosphate guanylyltransferase [Halalkalibacter wakoensis JCM 9140]